MWRTLSGERTKAAGTKIRPLDYRAKNSRSFEPTSRRSACLLAGCATQPADEAASAADPKTGENHHRFLKPRPPRLRNPGHLRRGGRGTSRSTPSRKLAWFCSGPLAGFYFGVDTDAVKASG
jgi:hypothetical protein